MSLKKLDLKRKVDLKNFTTIKIGGIAKYFFIAHSDDDLINILNSVDDYYVLGNGSNLLIKDSVISKPIIKLGKEFNYIKKNKRTIEIGAATTLSYILKYCIKNKLGGFSKLAGIPATLGGIIFMNASAFGSELTNYLKKVEVIDRKGKIFTVKREDISFGYRTSSLKDFIILRAYFDLPISFNLKEEINYILDKRYTFQEFSFPSCGCVFKNPKEKPAGLLIDLCGLKGKEKNGAQISLKHANFIINKNNAKYNDVDYLIGIIKENVYKKFTIKLEEEIKRWS